LTKIGLWKHEKCYIYNILLPFIPLLSPSIFGFLFNLQHPSTSATTPPYRRPTSTYLLHEVSTSIFSLKPSHQVSSCADRCIYTLSLKRLLCHIASLAEMEEVLSGLTGGVKNGGHTPKRTTQVPSGWCDDDRNDVFISVFEFSPSPGIEARYGYLESNSLRKAR